MCRDELARSELNRPMALSHWLRSRLAALRRRVIGRRQGFCFALAMAQPSIETLEAMPSGAASLVSAWVRSASRAAACSRSRWICWRMP
ncbi:hypothetical protein ACVWXQ_003589 [Bradyrhizobium sp. S3.14.4]